MGNIISYLKWRGDFSFEQIPFNEVDNLILSELAYAKMYGIVPGPEENRSILLKDAVAFYREENRGETKELGTLLDEMAKSRRFGRTKLSGYTDIIDDDEKTQFSAARAELENQTIYIAFRGTDSTIIGWREDFSISFQVVPAQSRAVQYLNETLREYQERKIYQAIGLFLAGAFLVAFPGFAQRIMGTAFFLWLLIFSCTRLYKYYKKWQEGQPTEKGKVLFYGVIAAAELLCIIKNSIVVVSTNFILGFFFGIRAWKQAKYAAEKRTEGGHVWLLPAADAVLEGH